MCSEKASMKFCALILNLEQKLAFSLVCFNRSGILTVIFTFFSIFNSRTAIAEAIIGLLLVFFYFVVMIFVTTI